HLAWLRRDGLVKTRKEAQTVYYSLSSHAVAEVIRTLHHLYCSAELPSEAELASDVPERHSEPSAASHSVG
ncbi:MAG: ArsR/SmtB family transcription factor, partial [Plesiomonas shigelloides]